MNETYVNVAQFYPKHFIRTSSFSLFTITVDVQNPNLQISAFWKIVRLLNCSDFERRLKSKLYRSDFKRSVH